MILKRRFFPYFMTQCLGALNDNVYKNVLLLLVTYSQVDELAIDIHLFVNLAAGLFILPFLLFSAHAGLIADSMDKARLIRRLKALELAIMSVAVFAIVSHSYLIMLVLLFLTGVQSAYFGPVKYSLLPRVLTESELVAGNAWVEMGTFMAILIGTLSAGLIVASDHGTYLAATLVLLLAGTGLVSSLFIPDIPVIGAVVKPKFAPLSGTWQSIQRVRKTPSIWIAILAISWFWFLGATYLTQFPNFARIVLNADATVVSLLLLLFSIGIGFGSLLCERLSFAHVELGLVPLGLLGLAVFGIDVYLAVPTSSNDSQYVYGLFAFLGDSQHYRLMLDLFMIGVSGGLFIVPLYAFIQARAKEGECAQAIAANNIINALFMVTSAICAMLLLGILGWDIVQLFLLLAVMNLLVLLLLVWRWSELTLSTMSYFARRVVNRVTVIEKTKLVKGEGAIVVTPSLNPLSILIIVGVMRQPVKFIIHRRCGDTRLARLILACIDSMAMTTRLNTTEGEVSAAKASLLSQSTEAISAGTVICVDDMTYRKWFSGPLGSAPILRVSLLSLPPTRLRDQIEVSIG